MNLAEFSGTLVEAVAELRDAGRPKPFHVTAIGRGGTLAHMKLEAPGEKPLLARYKPNGDADFVPPINVLVVDAGGVADHFVIERSPTTLTRVK